LVALQPKNSCKGLGKLNEHYIRRKSSTCHWAAGGIGLATAKAFALAGASVVVADDNEELLNEAAERLREEGHNALAVRCDVSEKAQVAAMIDLAVKTYGRLDAAFNNAGINCSATPMAETDDELFDRLININLRGAWNCMKGELRQMVTQGSGAIVNCSSIGGIVGSPGRTYPSRVELDRRPLRRHRGLSLQAPSTTSWRAEIDGKRFSGMIKIDGSFWATSLKGRSATG
jgi:NAD(P)-dependent dehydrogenase (short-subunit alcohol dehydrogenase family)